MTFLFISGLHIEFGYFGSFSDWEGVGLEDVVDAEFILASLASHFDVLSFTHITNIIGNFFEWKFKGKEDGPFFSGHAGTELHGTEENDLISF